MCRSERGNVSSRLLCFDVRISSVRGRGVYSRLQAGDLYQAGERVQGSPLC